MEKRNQIVIGLGILLLGLVGLGAYTGVFSSFMGKEMAPNMAAKADVAGMPTSATNPSAYSTTSGNIPGTNVNTTTVDAGPSTTIKYDNERFEFGTVNEGDMVKHTFKFTNTGKEPLIISNAKGSCGCTVPTWPKEAIAPGAQGQIDVEFNTSGKPGRQSKRVTVTANTIPTDTFIEVSGEVKPKAGAATAKGE
jgi:hypothetical protein